VTAAVAGELNIDFTRAEALKLRPGRESTGPEEDPAEQAALLRATGNFSGRLEMEIMRTVGNFCLRTGGEKPEAIYLTGGGSLLAGLAKTLAEKFKVPVERYDPLRNVELSERARAAGAESARHLLPNLVGLAVPVDADQDSESGLLPPMIRSDRAFRRRQPFILSAATLVALALLAPIRHYHGLATANEERAGEIAAQLQPLRESAKRNAAALETIATRQRDIAALRRAAAAKSNWLNFLADLQDRLGQVEDVWLEQLTMVPARAAGASGTATVPAAATQALQLRLSGRLLDVRNPFSKVSPNSYARVKQLLAGFARSPYIAAIEDERFDNAQPGLLRFDFTVVVNPSHPL
jgi:type IV pilus assembly protein PilM